jgi:hypothetical protein
VVAPAAAGTTSPEGGKPEGEGTNLRAVMIDLCQKNGIEFHKNASLAWLRKALAERSIVVN